MKAKKIISVFLSVILAFSCLSVIPASALENIVVGNDKITTSMQEYAVAPGITEHHITTVKKDGTSQVQSYAAVVDISREDVGFLAGYSDYKTDGTWKMQTVRDQAKAAAKARGKKIVIGMNADYFNMSTGEPNHALVMNGIKVHESNGGWYFAIKSDGTPVIDKGELPADTVEAIGSPFVLVQNGEVVEPDDGHLIPTGGIGLTAEGKVVFAVADGRQAPKSVGYTTHEMAQLMKSLGCVTAVYLDGGGSATFVSRTAGEEDLTVKNSPSDGTERLVSSSLFFYSDAEPDGVFSSAALLPKGDVYTPGSVVAFSALGSDASGTKVELPEDGKFALDDSAKDFGEITDDGVFTSNGKLGTVKVNYVLDGQVKGSTEIEIQHPDSIFFTNDEIGLGFNESSELGLAATHNNLQVNFKAGDFNWRTEPEFTDGKYVFVQEGGNREVNANQGLTLKYYEGDEILDELSAEDIERVNSENGITKDQYVLGAAYILDGKGVIVDYDGRFKFTYADSGVELTEEEAALFAATVMGTFDGNTFISSDDNTISGNIICTYKDNEKLTATIHMIIGKAPTVVMDFEDEKDEEGNTLTPAVDYWTYSKAAFEPSGGTIVGAWKSGAPITPENEVNPTSTKLIHGSYCDGGNKYALRKGVETLELVDIASGEPVRFGNYSMKLNFDFENVSSTEGACFGFSEQTQQIPGSPTGIGVYVYAPENTPNLWLRIRVKDGMGTIQNLDFTPSDGISWTGWRYLEVSLKGKQGPFSLIGGETFRTMWVAGSSGNFYCTENGLDENGKMQYTKTPITASQRKGSIYIDNLQFVYGANTDDIDDPIIDQVTANNEALEDGSVITSNKVNFQARVTDVQNKYTSGVNYDTAYVYVDGVLQNSVTDPSKDALMLQDFYLANGDHNIRFLIRDGFGNEATKTINFTVNGDSQDTPSVSVVPKGESALLCGTADFAFVATKVEEVKTMTSSVKIPREYSEFTVEYADGFEEAAAPVYNAKDRTITVSAKRTADAQSTGEGEIAVVKVKVPATILKGSNFDYSVSVGKFTVSTENGSDREVTFSSKALQMPVTAKYTLSIPTITEGFDTKLTVYDAEGEPVKNIAIYTSAGQKIGTTGLDGSLYTSIFRDAQSISLYAEDAEGYRSFVENTQTYPTGAKDDGTPTFVSVNANTGDTDTSKNITWISKPGVAKQQAVVLYAEKADFEANGEAAFVKAEGTSENLEIGGSSLFNENRVVYVNNVDITDLKSGTEYVYRAGDGKRWSDTYEFRTAYKGEDTTFFVIGDTQAEDTESIGSIKEILSLIGKDNYTFGVQTGDFVEQAAIYNYWNAILNAFDDANVKKADMIHVIGNHETYGDDDSVIASALFNLESNKHYSVTYGNVYVAVLGFTSSSSVAEENAKWLVEDAAKSDALWKVVVLHQPPYGTNETSDDNAGYNKYLPAACEEAGIDFVFSGHDHSFARTEPITNNEVDEENGVVYYICGSTGEKSYTASNTRGYKFARMTTDFEGLYLKVTTTDSKFEVTAYDKDGSIFDSYTKTKSSCVNGSHAYLLKSDGHLVCEYCAYSRLPNGYTGFVRDYVSYVPRYFVNGELVYGRWLTVGDDSYYIGEDGYAVSGTVTIDGKQYTFDNGGKFIRGSFVTETITMEDGTEKEIIRYYTAGGVYATRWLEIDGNLYHFRKRAATAVRPDDGEMFYGGKFKVRTAAGGTSRNFTFDENGVLIKGCFENVLNDDGSLRGTRYYWGPEYVTTGDWEVNGVIYNFDNDGYMILKDINDCDSFSLSTTEYTYTGNTHRPGVTVTDGESTLIKNTNFTVTYKNDTEIGTGTVTITGNPERGYTGTKTLTYTIVPKQVTKVKAASADGNGVKLTYASVKGAGVYSVWRATSKDGTYKKVGTSKTTSYTDKTAKIGTTYYYKVRVYKTVGGTRYVGEFSSVVSGKAVPATAKIKTVSITSSSTVKVSWSKATGATAYSVYRATSKNGTYKRLGATSSTSYTDKTAKIGTTYYYTVKAYKTVNGKNVTAELSAAKSIKVVPAQAKISSVENTASKTVTVSWAKVSGATAYSVWRSTSKNGTYKHKGTTASTSYTDKTAKAGTTYYYKVRACKTVSGKTVAGAFSAVKSVKVTK